MNSKYQSVFHRVDESVLTLLSKRDKAVDASIYTKSINKQLKSKNTISNTPGSNSKPLQNLMTGF